MADDSPPSYMSQNGQNSTISDGIDPPLSAILKSNHSTHASRLYYAVSQGRHTLSEYYQMTFSIIFAHNNIRSAVVIALDEDLETLIGDIQRMFVHKLNPVRVKQLRVYTSGGLDLGNSAVLDNENMTATLRLLKSRNGVDTIFAK